MKNKSIKLPFVTKKYISGAICILLTHDLLQNSKLISFINSPWQIQTLSFGRTVLFYLPYRLFFLLSFLLFLPKTNSSRAAKTHLIQNLIEWQNLTLHRMLVVTHQTLCFSDWLSNCEWLSNPLTKSSAEPTENVEVSPIYEYFLLFYGRINMAVLN